MDEKKILLINPHEYYSESIISSSESTMPPLGLLYIAAVLEEKHKVKIIDLNASNTKTKPDIKRCG